MDMTPQRSRDAHINTPSHRVPKAPELPVRDDCVRCAQYLGTPRELRMRAECVSHANLCRRIQRMQCSFPHGLSEEMHTVSPSHSPPLRRSC